MATITTSEFAALIKSRLPDGWVSPFRGDIVANVCCVWQYVPNRGMLNAVHVYESEKGCSRISVRGKKYSQMNAAEKRDAVEFFNNLRIERVVFRRVCHTPAHGDIVSTPVEYWVEGDFAKANAARNELNRIPDADILSIEKI